MKYADILAIYEDSNGDATKALYARLEPLGPVGQVAINLFRAHKTSGRAKKYRGGGYRGKAYDRKQWSIGNLCGILAEHGEALGIRWGWKIDESREIHKWVIYIDLPTGQVSFHSEYRGTGPDYPGEWDMVIGAGPVRICKWIEDIFKGAGHGTEQRNCLDGSHLQPLARLHQGGTGV